MKRLALILLFALMPFSAKADSVLCAKPADMHKELVRVGYFPFAAAITDYGFIIKTFVGKDGFVMIAEDHETSCVLTTGKRLLMTKESKA